MIVIRNGRREMLSGKCAYCGKHDLLSKDHILAKSHGGTDDPSNIALVCWSCNSSKWNFKFNSVKEVKDWMSFQKKTGLWTRESYYAWKEFVDSRLPMSMISTMKNFTLPKLKCKRKKCGHEWTPRQMQVRICPKCKSARWDSPKAEK